MKQNLLLVGLLCLVLFSENTWSNLRVMSWETSRSSQVYFVRAPEIPMVDIRLVFGAGSARDGQQAGLAKIVNRLLLEGAGDLRAIQFKDRLAMTGARLHVDSLREMAFISLRTLKGEEFLTEAVELLALAASKARFDSKEIRRIIDQIRLELRLKEQSLSAVADAKLWREIYGDHPYGSSPLGNDRSLEGITRKDLLEFYQTYYVNKNLVVAIVGDLHESEAESLAESITAALPLGEPAPSIPVVPSSGTVREITIPRDSKQTHIRLGKPGMTRNDPDYFPLLVGNHVLGGNSLVSILFREIRSKRGLSYSTYSYFVPMEVPGPFVVGMQTESSNTKRAMEVLSDTLNNFVDKGPSDKDLKLAKSNLIKGFPNRIDSNQKILGYIAMIGFYGLPLDYLETFGAKVAAVGRVDVKSAFSRRIGYDFSTVIVGKDFDLVD